MYKKNLTYTVHITNKKMTKCRYIFVILYVGLNRRKYVKYHGICIIFKINHITGDVLVKYILYRLFRVVTTVIDDVNSIIPPFKISQYSCNVINYI